MRELKVMIKVTMTVVVSSAVLLTNEQYGRWPS